MKHLTLAEQIVTVIAVLLIALMSIRIMDALTKPIDVVILIIMSLVVIGFILWAMITINDTRSHKALIREYNNIRTQLLVTKLEPKVDCDECPYCEACEYSTKR